MGIVGRYIDMLSDNQRDRVIEAKDWTPAFVDDDDPTCRCLVGHAEDYDEKYHFPRDPMLLPDGTAARRTRNTYGNQEEVFIRVPSLFIRFGKDRIVAACKARAAEGNRAHEIRAEVYEKQREAGLVAPGGMYGSTLLEEK